MFLNRFTQFPKIHNIGAVGAKGDWDFWIFVVNYGEVQRAQLAKSTLLTSSLVHLGSFQIFKFCSDAKERVGCRKQWEATAPIHP